MDTVYAAGLHWTDALGRTRYRPFISAESQHVANHRAATWSSNHLAAWTSRVVVTEKPTNPTDWFGNPEEDA